MEMMPPEGSYIFATNELSSTLYTWIKFFLFMKIAIYLELVEISASLMGDEVLIIAMFFISTELSLICNRSQGTYNRLAS